jgi:hypothetical protein
MRTLSLASLATVLALAASRCGGATCLRNSDCSSNLVCEVGACVQPAASKPPREDAGTDAPADAPSDATGGSAGAGSGGAGEGGASAQ